MMFFPTVDGQKSESSSSSSLQSSQPCRRFEFPEIELATDNFDESLVIGHGGFGKVYEGTIVNGANLVVAAIKRLDSMSNQGATEFWAEVEMLSKLRHSHLVSLLGYCNDGKEMILIYEYMPYGTFADHLHKFPTPLILVAATQDMHLVRPLSLALYITLSRAQIFCYMKAGRLKFWISGCPK